MESVRILSRSVLAEQVKERLLEEIFSGRYAPDARIVETQVARELGVNEGTLGNWVARDREKRQNTDGLSTGDIEELKRLRAEVAELRMERDVLKRSVVLWVKEATK